MATEWIDDPEWKFGRVYLNKNGEKVYVLERMHNKNRVTKSLGAITLKQANARAALFDENPELFAKKTEAPPRPEAVVITADLILEFQAYLGEPPEPRSREYISVSGAYLAQIARALNGADMRTIGHDGLGRALDTIRRPKPGGKGPGRGPGIAVRNRRLSVFKSYCDWLVTKKKLLTSATNPSLDLKIEPERNARPIEERAYPVGYVEAVYSKIASQAARDVILLRVKTGIHVTELDRIAKGDRSEIKPLKDQGEIAAWTIFPHKKGKPHAQSLDAQSLAALERLRARGKCPDKSYLGRALKRAAQEVTKETGVKQPAPELGRLRHCFTTWGRDGRLVYPHLKNKIPLEIIGAVMGHAKNSKMTGGRYDGSEMEIPLLVVVPVNLVHKDDPPLTSASSE